MKQDPREYFRRREQMERVAAERATSPEARRVHQELARRYAASLGKDGVGSDVETALQRSRLAVVTKLH